MFKIMINNMFYLHKNRHSINTNDRFEIYFIAHSNLEANASFIEFTDTHI